MTRSPRAEREKKSLSENITSFKDFRRAIHARGGLDGVNKGLGEARKRLCPSSTAQIVREAMGTALYRNALARNPFPPSFGKIKKGRALPIGAEKVEAFWSAAVLSHFSEELNGFVALKHKFQTAISRTDFTNAELQLGAIEKQYGLSLWSISSRITLLQLHTGNASQKSYLQSIVAHPGISPLIAYLSYLYSYLSEDNVSLADVMREWSKLDKSHLGQHTTQYIKYHASPFALSAVDSPWTAVSLEENSPIIDRYETYLNMAALAFVRADNMDEIRYLREALDLLAGINDRRIGNLINMFEGGVSNDPENELVASSWLASMRPTADAAVESIQKGIEQFPSLVTLHQFAARVGLATGKPVRLQGQGKFANELISYFEDVIGLSDSYHQSRFSLQKTVLLLRNFPAARSIAAFLDTAEDRVIGSRALENEAVQSLSGPLGDPVQLPTLAAINSDAIIETYRLSFAENAASNLAGAISLPESKGDDVIVSADVEGRYRDLLMGHRHFNLGNYENAEANYLRYKDAAAEYESKRADLFIYMSRAARGDINGALSVFVDAYLRDEASYLIFPMTALVGQVKAFAGVNDSALNRAIFFNAFLQHISTKHDGDLSDAFEDVLDLFGVDRPSRLIPKVINNPDSEKWTYFLVSVCTIRRLEDSTRLHNYEEIEAERLAILNGLAELRPELAEMLSLEIVELTREREVAHLTQQFDRSRIYVDEVGVKQFMEVQLSDAITRYQKLNSDIALREQRTVENLVLQLLKTSGAEFKTIELPATEKGSVLLGVHDLVMDAFVLHHDYGLKTNLTTRVSHGSLEGELRSSFTKYKLLFSDETDAEFDDEWKQILKLSPGDYRLVKVAVARFSKRVGDAILDLKDRKVRIKMSPTPHGLMSFEPTKAELAKLDKEIGAAKSADHVADIVIAHLWRKVDGSLVKIREEIEGDFRRKVTSAADALRDSLGSVGQASSVIVLSDALTLAQTEFQQSIERVLAWFRRGARAPVGSFSFDRGIEVAARLTNSRFPTRLINPHVLGACELIVPGQKFLPILDILRNCFQNAVEHGGFSDRAPNTVVEAKVKDNVLQLTVENELSRDRQLSELRTRVAATLSSDLAEPTGKPGRGTGLKEIRRILKNPGFGESHPLVSVTDDFKLTVSFSISLSA